MRFILLPNIVLCVRKKIIASFYRSLNGFFIDTQFLKKKIHRGKRRSRDARVSREHVASVRQFWPASNYDGAEIRTQKTFSVVHASLYVWRRALTLEHVEQQSPLINNQVN